MSTYFVSGASRGLGLSLVQVLASEPTNSVSKVFAGTRSQEPSEPLAKVINDWNGRVEHVALDLSSQSNIKSAANTVATSVQGAGLDWLINNAAVREDSWTPKLEDMTYLRQALDTNVAATHDVITAFLPLLREGKEKKIVTISSTLGSITTAQTDPKLSAVAFPAYKISKAGAHMLTVLWSNQLRGEGFCVYLQSPGNLRTELAGGDRADLQPEVGAKQVIHNLQTAKPEDTGRHRNIWVEGWEEGGGVGGKYDGQDILW